MQFTGATLLILTIITIVMIMPNTIVPLFYTCCYSEVLHVLTLSVFQQLYEIGTILIAPITNNENNAVLVRGHTPGT